MRALAPRIALIALPFVLCTIAGASQAHAGWSAPQVLNAPSTDASGTHVVTTPLGETVTVWIEQDESNPFPMRMMARVKRADGTLEDAVEIAPELGGCVLDLATDGLGNVVASWQLPDSTIKAARRPPGGKFGPAEIVNDPPYSGGSSPVLAMNHGGDAAVMWAEFTQDGGGQWTHSVAVSRGGAPFGEPVQLEPWRDIAFGGYDVALTPIGDVVGVWSINPERWDPEDPTYGDPARVKTATLTPSGVVTSEQTLAEFSGAATCPQVLSDGRGRVAALWHEIHFDYCAVWGRDMLALRKAGPQFDQPVEVPTSAGNVSYGSLAVSEDGDITVAFSDQDGGEVVQGSFDKPLEVVVPRFPAYGTPSLSGAENGEVVFGSAEGSQLETARLRPNGDLDPPQDLRADCSHIRYATFDVNRSGLASAVMLSDDWNLELATDSSSAVPGTRRCNPGSASSWGEPDAPSAPSGSSAPPASSSGVTPAAAGLVLNVEKSQISRRGGKLRLKVRVNCGLACSLAAQGKLIGRGGKRLARATATRWLARGAGWLPLELKLPHGLPATRRPKRVSLRLTASDPGGNVLVRKLSVAVAR